MTAEVIVTLPVGGFLFEFFLDGTVKRDGNKVDTIRSTTTYATLVEAANEYLLTYGVDAWPKGPGVIGKVV